jgi:hypothetical protein
MQQLTRDHVRRSTQVCQRSFSILSHRYNTCRAQLLNLAVPLVKQHGFTRTALARSVLALPEPRSEPLSDSAVTTLFGEGDTARRALIGAWLDQGRVHMRSAAVDNVKGALLVRLEYNLPVLEHLIEVSRLRIMRYIDAIDICRRLRLLSLRNIGYRPLTSVLQYSTRQVLLTRHVE